MKKVLITHIPNTLNYGSAMMAINLIAGLRKELGNKIEIFIECDDYNLERLKVATGDEKIKNISLPKSEKSTILQKIKRYVFGLDAYIHFVTSEFDFMIVLGGDDLSETYSQGAIVRGIIYRHINKKCRVVLAGQSLGPFYGIHRAAAKFLFKNIAVITRDDNSFEFSKNILKIDKVFKGRDFALLSLPKQGDFNSVISRLNLTDQRYCVFVPSGLHEQYTEDTDGYVETWVEIIRKIAAQSEFEKVVILSHVLKPDRVSDSRISEIIYEKMDSELKSKTLLIDDVIQPAEARAVLGGSEFVITGRMHAAVSTFFMRKPAIAIVYSEKYSGVIGRGLGMGRLLVEGRNREWGKNSEIINEIFDLSETIIENYSKIINDIDENVSDCSSIVEKQIRYIAEIINNSEKVN